MDTERLSPKELLRLRRKEALDGQTPALSPRPASIKKRVGVSVLALAVVAASFGAGYYVADNEARAREAVLSTQLERTTADFEDLREWAATTAKDYNTLSASYSAASQALSDAQDRAAAAEARANAKPKTITKTKTIVVPQYQSSGPPGGTGYCSIAGPMTFGC